MNLEFIIKPLTQLFSLINNGVMSFIPDKGTAYFIDIFIFTLLLKMILLPLQIKQTKSMVKMNEMQPKMKEIQDKYKNDPQKLQQKQMELYKEAGVNPLGGCLPMLIQLPVFMAMYAVIYRYQGFTDASKVAFLGVVLSSKHHLILSIISGATTYASGKILTPAPVNTDKSDPSSAMTKNMNFFMAIFMGYMSWTVKGAFVYYWIISNVLGFLQQYFIMGKYRKKEESKLTK